MAKSVSDAEVKAFMATDRYKSIVSELRNAASAEKRSLSPNDVPEVKVPLDRDKLKRLFSKPFLTS